MRVDVKVDKRHGARMGWRRFRVCGAGTGIRIFGIGRQCTRSGVFCKIVGAPIFKNAVFRVVTIFLSRILAPVFFRVTQSHMSAMRSRLVIGLAGSIGAGK